MVSDRGFDRCHVPDALPDDPDALVGRPGWQERAACTGAPPGTFTGRYVTADVTRICGACPVRLVCLSWAVQHNETGLWAGTTEADRKLMRRERDDARQAEGRPRPRKTDSTGLRITHGRRNVPPGARRRRQPPA